MILFGVELQAVVRSLCNLSIRAGVAFAFSGGWLRDDQSWGQMKGGAAGGFDASTSKGSDSTCRRGRAEKKDFDCFMGVGPRPCPY